MTQSESDDTEMVACVNRLMQALSECPSNNSGGHRWNISTGYCVVCGAAWPYGIVTDDDSDT